MLDSRTNGVDVNYARAVGRGKHAEADVSWAKGSQSMCWQKTDIDRNTAVARRFSASNCRI